jgi:hypothetical protein
LEAPGQGPAAEHRHHGFAVATSHHPSSCTFGGENRPFRPATVQLDALTGPPPPVELRVWGRPGPVSARKGATRGHGERRAGGWCVFGRSQSVCVGSYRSQPACRVLPAALPIECEVWCTPAGSNVIECEVWCTPTPEYALPGPLECTKPRTRFTQTTAKCAKPRPSFTSDPAATAELRVGVPGMPNSLPEGSTRR